ncbi:isoprenylcysteine carboxylmethyltransferase family protein [Lentzea sp. NBRC 105346]|uniref:methyltransferase family protein n=1 Tax=Lentzea sp. NBRC 105346 TaxID=3032205 RepID=UPI00255646F7|nr:isoprenylcysteine carboxylmethyltransferase family protein [Lentzea sp. NBRC 105346]
MEKRKAALGSAAFFVLAPGGVAGLIPWLLTRWEALPFWLPLRVVGVLLLVAALAVLISSFARFVAEGFGTPAPVAPPDRLVVGGFYRFVRNPMYLAVLSLIIGQALVLGQLILLAYAAVVSAAFAAMVHWHEEPALHRQFGDQYDTYRAAVPGWVPRLRPWHADSQI